MFNDSFIDSLGELLIIHHLKEKDIDYNSYNILDKLSLIGNNTMGGFTCRPSKNLGIEIKNISNEDMLIVAKLSNINEQIALNIINKIKTIYRINIIQKQY